MCHPSCCLQALKTTTRPPNSYFARFLVVSWLAKPSKINDFPLVFQGFCNLAFLPHIMPAAALLSPRSASRGPPGPPKKGQGGPKIAQDGPKMGPKSGAAQRQNPARYVLEPFRAHLGANLGHFGLKLARPYQHRRQFAIQVAVFKPSRPQQDLPTATLRVLWWPLGSQNLQKSVVFIWF